jgi:hypothetical protein
LVNPLKGFTDNTDIKRLLDTQVLILKHTFLDAEFLHFISKPAVQLNAALLIYTTEVLLLTALSSLSPVRNDFAKEALIDP